jgi:endonuclease/exonuclease/phosphatase family metal-dependent hydrolase
MVHLRYLLPRDEPCILGGDFNEDFHPRRLLSEEMGMTDVFESLDLPPPATHPARPCDPREDSFPNRTLDWIFTLLPTSDRVVSAFVKQPRTSYPHASDHMPVLAVIECNGGVHPFNGKESSAMREAVRKSHSEDLDAAVA